jgi:hypothetical protein
MVHPLPEGRDIALHRDVDATVANLEAVAPGFRRLVLGRSVRSPERLERRRGPGRASRRVLGGSLAGAR